MISYGIWFCVSDFTLITSRIVLLKMALFQSFLYFLYEIWVDISIHENRIFYILCKKTWVHISIYENWIFCVSCMKIWVCISIWENQIFVFSVWNMGAYFHMWESYFLYFLYENMSSDSSFSSLDRIFLACGDCPLQKILPNVHSQGSVGCSHPSRLSPAFIVCERVRMPLWMVGLDF